ncbi:MAG: tRNA lysidine(34) synthetase TilS [Planctomycetaceae bacterium]|nr:tRNA lysidine(34) synthetase TilS [Planctomycetaceae bacterium]
MRWTRSCNGQQPGGGQQSQQEYRSPFFQVPTSILMSSAEELSRPTFDLPRFVADWCKRQGVCGTRLLVAVSGGADSVALLRAVRACRQELTLDIRVAHLDHGLRDDSPTDAAWVCDLADELGLPHEHERVDVRCLAAERGRGLEETARQARYEFLRRAAAEHHCSHLAVAHTADDQVETILHHLIRGTGLAGLRGIPETRALTPQLTLIHPLRNVARADVLMYLDVLGQDYRQDPSNDDPWFTRNRLRHTLLPLLRRDFNPLVSDALMRLGRQVDDVQEIVANLAGQLLQSCLIERDPQWALVDCTFLAGSHAHLVREAMRRLWTEQDWPRQRMGFDDWDRLARLALSSDAASSLDLSGGIHARRRGPRLELRRS